MNTAPASYAGWRLLARLRANFTPEGVLLERPEAVCSEIAGFLAGDR